jgi:CubicO group peptidase (beta-lactamase class C family)
VPSPAAEEAAKYAAAVASFVKEHRLPGAAAGIVHGSELVWSGGAGFADIASKRRSSPTTLYRIASITKTFTATLIMLLRDEGKLALDDAAADYLPELERAASPFVPLEQLTIRRLLSHESGLQSEPPGTDWTAVQYETQVARTLERVSEITATIAPNTQWKYSNLGYQLLGEIVARVSGTPYAKFLRTRILTPLKMTSTSFEPLSARLRTRMATGYDPRFLSDELDPAPVTSSSVFEAEGGLISCVEDLGRWLSFQLGEGKVGRRTIVAKETLAEMHKPRYLVDEAWTRAWAIGWYARRQDDVVWRLHTGGHYGFITAAMFEPTEKIGAIALLNGFANASDLAVRIGTMARDAVRAAAPSIEPPQKLPAEWRDLPGLYLGAHFDNVVRLEWRDGKLTFLDPGDPTWKPTLAPTDEADVFTVEPGARESGELVRFSRGKKGRVVRVNVAVATLERLEPAEGATSA